MNSLSRPRESESILHRIVLAIFFAVGTVKLKQRRQQLMEVICSDKLIPYLNKWIEILESIDTEINDFQNDHALLSKVFENFALVMRQLYESMNCLSSEERSYILKLLMERLKIVYGDAFEIPHILDPVLLETDMVDEHKMRAGHFIFEWVSQGVVIIDENPKQCKAKREQLSVEYTD